MLQALMRRKNQPLMNMELVHSYTLVRNDGGKGARERVEHEVIACFTLMRAGKVLARADTGRSICSV